MLTVASSVSYISMYCKLLVIPDISRWGISTPSTCAVAPGAKLAGDQPNTRSLLLPMTPSRSWSPEPPVGSGGAPAQPPPPRKQRGGFIRKCHPSAAGVRKGTLGRRAEHKRGAFLSCPRCLRETWQVAQSRETPCNRTRRRGREESSGAASGLSQTYDWSNFDPWDTALMDPPGRRPSPPYPSSLLIASTVLPPHPPLKTRLTSSRGDASLQARTCTSPHIAAGVPVLGEPSAHLPRRVFPTHGS